MSRIATTIRAFGFEGNPVKTQLHLPEDVTRVGWLGLLNKAHWMAWIFSSVECLVGNVGQFETISLAP